MAEGEQKEWMVLIKQACKMAMADREKAQSRRWIKKDDGYGTSDEEEEKGWVVSIKEKLAGGRRGEAEEEEEEGMPSIFMASSPLRGLKHEAFVPQVVAIGPIHSDLGPHHSSFPENPDTQRYKAIAASEMEKHKVAASLRMAASLPSGDFCDLARRFRSLTSRVRAQYDSDLDCRSDEKLAYMLALDAAFVVEVLRCSALESSTSSHLLKTSFSSYYCSRFPRPLRKSIFQDFVLLENQIPLFLLLEVVRSDKSRCHLPEAELQHEAIGEVGSLVTRVACEILPFYFVSEASFEPVLRDLHSSKHLLDFLYKVVTQAPSSSSPKFQKLVEKPTHFPSAVDLHNCGISFRAVAPGYMNSVSFDAKRAVLFVPKIRVGDDTERLLRNFIAYESHLVDRVDVLSYLRFMNSLVDNSDDVDLLVGKGVIAQDIGSNEEVAHMFNNLCVNTMRVCSSEYEEVAKQLMKHCDFRLNALKAEFKRAYLSRPWLVISVLSGASLLLMTFVIMYYTIKLYMKDGG